MQRRRLAAFIAALTCSTAVATVPLAAQTNLVSNPGFESGLTGWDLLPSPGCAYFGDTPTAATSTDAHTGTTSGAVTGNGCFAYLSQSVSFTVGHDYAMSFWYKVLGTPSVADPATIVLRDPTNADTGWITDVTAPNDGWTQFALRPRTATTTSGVFGAGGQWPGGGILIDDVSITDVTTTPEPASLMLLGTGLVGLVPMLKRRRTA